MAIDWNQYQQAPDTGGITGMTTVDPSQLQIANGGVNGSGPNPLLGPSTYSSTNPYYNYTGPNADVGLLGGGGSGPGISLQTPAPTSPMYQSQGGSASDPRWTNGTWGGATTMPMTPPPPNPYSGMLAGATGGTTGSTQDPQAFFNQLFPGQTLSPDMLAQNEAALKAQGITIIRNAAGQPSKIRLPDGSVVDPIVGAGSGQNQKAWNVVAGPGGVPLGGGGGSLGSVGMGSFVSPIGQFTPPTAQDALNSPGLQFALDEANRMGQNSAAAKGTLLNGRFQQALAASNIQNALQGYGNVYNQAANTYGINFNTQVRNQDSPYSKYLSLAQLGQTAGAAS